VKYSRAFKVLLACALVLSLGWKLFLRPAASDDASVRSAQSRLAEFLSRQHYSVTLAERAADGQPSIIASTGACRILAVRSPAMGTDRDLVRRLASPSDGIFILYKGKIYDEQPTFRTVADFLWARMLREVGIGVQQQPVFAIISPQSCNSRRLPWDELAVAARVYRVS
jgi:hypothetical protein